MTRANLGRLRLQHWEAEAPNAIMGWTVFQPQREQWTRQRYQRAPRKACAAARKRERCLDSLLLNAHSTRPYREKIRALVRAHRWERLLETIADPHSSVRMRFSMQGLLAI